MIPDIRQLLDAKPFVPFTVYLADGGKAPIEAAGHLFILPQGSRVIIANDDDGYEVVPAESITRIVVDPVPHTPND